MEAKKQSLCEEGVARSLILAFLKAGILTLDIGITYKLYVRASVLSSPCPHTADLRATLCPYFERSGCI